MGLYIHIHFVRNVIRIGNRTHFKLISVYILFLFIYSGSRLIGDKWDIRLIGQSLETNSYLIV